ncbi:hypothetical protein WMY93_005221 [Mugilogobius chulae]|uniref:Neurogenic locus notch homolog protein 1 n=1 Tax=Mugilogobius chulae TaxID=88201 RepID=A0AAW0Q5M5_9GOBI
MHILFVKLTLLWSLISLTRGQRCLMPTERCLNQGTCERTPDGLGECKCRNGFVGSRCQFHDPCTTAPCMNGATCRAISKGNTVDFNCTCKLGFSDRRCMTPINNICMNSPCHNGATCELETLQTYKCRCPPGWSGWGISMPVSPGVHWQTLRNTLLPLQSIPCLNGGTCVQKGDTSYECSCVPGFTGKNCNINIDDCPDHECQNGGTCVDGVNTYNCQCKPEFTGQLCTDDVDECQLMPNACQNGGTCHNTFGSYQCVCVNGWTGDDCSENIDDCASAACSHGSTCHDRVASFVCECPHGRAGLLCQLEDACISNPCRKGSNCDINPVSGTHFCTCPLGYIGVSCDQDVDECSLGPNPCEHAGKCINTKGSFQCKCQRGYVGPRCELDINECISNPCMNEATCLDQIGDFQCICMPGYEGEFCENDTNECASNPCLNNGKCIDKINNFLCQCPTGFTGSLCQIDIDECASTPCKNGAKCTDGPNKYTCECTEGYSGKHCDTDINECFSDPCHYGTCMMAWPPSAAIDRDNFYNCNCPKGTTGINCEINIDDCKSNPCDYGTCLDKINGYECACEPGYTGTMCNINIDECANSPCHNGGTCIDGINGFTCVCPEGYHDTTCFSQVNECLSNPCIHGHCEDKINGYSCICDSGWTGKNCDINNNECESNPCMNGGTCKDMISGYICICRVGFTGPNCKTNINECASNPCLNQGTCIDDVAGYKCVCSLPYTGENCETLMAPCSSKPCRHGGVCQESEDYQSFSCACPEGWQGQTCDVDIKECVKNPCRNGATCQNTLGSYQCNCKPGFTGRNCETDIDDCKPNPCSNGGVCKDEVNGFLCTCLPGFRGIKCEEDINECESNPCKMEPTLVSQWWYMCRWINTFTCVCPPGFTGNYCQHDINECDSKPCMNGGTCHDSYGTYKCTCPQGYTGPNCQDLVRWCESSPCKNGGSCWHRDTTYSCQCATGWGGQYCDVPSVSCEVAAKQRGVDVTHLCHNSGQCLDAGNVHYCHCQLGYTGSYCEEQVDECNPNPCQNGATCTDFLGGYTCKCMPGFVGTNCSDEINECFSQPCQNGGTCIDLINTYKCSCPRGTQGVHCEINIDDCNPFIDLVTNEPKCFNKGKCVDRVGGYNCACPSGYVGERCEGDVNECLSNPCDPRGTHSCIQLTNNYRCECRTGYTGRHCDLIFDGCKGKPCRNGGPVLLLVIHHMDLFANALLVFQVLHVSMMLRPVAPFTVIMEAPVSLATKVHQCTSNPCYNGGTCENTSEAPYYFCVCPPNFIGQRCHILDRGLQEEECGIPECEELKHNKICDVVCNNHACGWDNGDCSLNFDDPWKNCSASLQCWRYFNNGKCDSQCDNAGCLYDGFDCQNLEGQCNPMYDQYCRDHYADGHCDQGCNNAECGWDGLDCANTPEKIAVGQLVLVVHIVPEQLLNNSFGFLRELSLVLRTNVLIRRDSKGQMMVYPYYGNQHELKKYNVKRSVDTWSNVPAKVLHIVKRTVLDSSKEHQLTKRELDPLQIKGSIVHLEVDNRQCFQQSSECFQSTNEAAAFLGALKSSDKLDVPYTIEAVYSGVNPQPSQDFYPIYLVLGGVGLLAFLGVGMVAARKRRHEHGRLWLPEGFKTSESSKKKRREPVGEDSVGLKPLKTTSDISLMDNAQNDWGEDESSDLKHTDDQTDHRQWTQQHLDAADLRIPSIAPTPPQGEIENDCMDVNVRGPDGFTPLMIASCSGGGLETGNSEEEEDASANVINDFIYQGANSLHLAARYARSDAAKRLLEASADANIQDNMGRTPLHAAVAADAQGVFQILIRNRATDLDARMHDGTTPLILAARLAVEGMVEELINCHADVNAIDDFGKSALHWAAAVNNVEAAIVLLKNGANKDMQNNKEETPLFLAAREGSYETAKVLLDHFANREITDHMDRLPRDIAQERMHHDIVRLMDEYNLVRSPQMHAGSLSTTLSPPLCSPNGYLGSMKQPPPQGTCLGKKSRKPSVKGIGCKEGKEMKVKKKNSQDGKSGNLLDSSAVLSPVDSLESPHGYVSDVASPPMMTSPFQQSPSVSLNHLQSMSDPHLAVNHMVLPSKQDLARMQFDPLPPRLSHLPVSSSTGPAAINGQCDWLSRIHGNMSQSGQFNPIRGGPAGQGGLHQGGQHGLIGSHHSNHASATLSQMISYQGIPNGRLAPPNHIMQQQAQQIQQMQNLQQIQQQSIQLQHQNPNTGNSQNFMNGELSSPELQQGTGSSNIPIHTILPQDTQIRPTSMNQSIPSTQFLTPPSQHSYSGALDNTPNHQVQVPDHPFLTPSPGSPDQWSSSSPHSNMSDWSEGISSPPTSLPSQIGPTRTV